METMFNEAWMEKLGISLEKRKHRENRRSEEVLRGRSMGVFCGPPRKSGERQAFTKCQQSAWMRNGPRAGAAPGGCEEICSVATAEASPLPSLGRSRESASQPRKGREASAPNTSRGFSLKVQ